MQGLQLRSLVKETGDLELSLVGHPGHHPPRATGSAPAVASPVIAAPPRAATPPPPPHPAGKLRDLKDPFAN